MNANQHLRMIQAMMSQERAKDPVGYRMRSIEGRGNAGEARPVSDTQWAGLKAAEAAQNPAAMVAPGAGAASAFGKAVSGQKLGFLDYLDATLDAAGPAGKMAGTAAAGIGALIPQMARRTGPRSVMNRSVGRSQSGAVGSGGSKKRTQSSPEGMSNEDIAAALESVDPNGNYRFNEMDGGRLTRDELLEAWDEVRQSDPEGFDALMQRNFGASGGAPFGSEGGGSYWSMHRDVFGEAPHPAVEGMISDDAYYADIGMPSGPESRIEEIEEMYKNGQLTAAERRAAKKYVTKAHDIMNNRFDASGPGGSR